MAALAEKLKQLRVQCGYTQIQVGDLLGTTNAAISAYELGTNKPSAQKIYQLAAIYRTSASYLLDRDEPRTIDISDLTESQEATLRRIIIEFTKTNEP